MRLSDFDYDLPPELVAQEPAVRRDGSRLMVVDAASGAISHHVFSDLPSVLDRSDLVVLNDTKVIPARLIAKKTSGGRIEILLVRRLPGEMETWECMAQSSRGLKPGTVARFPGGESCVVEARVGDGLCRVRFDSAASLDTIVAAYGDTPLPPYIRRPGGAGTRDAERYQTVYARNPGSCAAPTAGLHFTPALLDALKARTAGVVPVTLHVGPGTFLPVRTGRVEDHRMHAEWFEIPAAAAERISASKRSGGRVTAVGTTVVRTLEHAAAPGGTIEPATGTTDIFIKPGHRFRVVDRLLTNFHLPRSTLLMLVCAFMGRDLAMRAYAEAIRERYRFYSYGDAMLVVT